MGPHERVVPCGYHTDKTRSRRSLMHCVMTHLLYALLLLLYATIELQCRYGGQSVCGSISAGVN